MLSRRRVATLIATAAALALATPAGAQAADCGAAADSVPDASNLTQVGQATLCLLNNERGAQGLRPVTEAPGLTQPSLAYSARMVAESFFAHESPDGGTLVDRLTAVGYIAADGDWTVGENIAWGQGELSTPRSIVAAWMASPGHRKNILTGEFTEIGLGVVTGTPGDTSWGATYTTDFGAVVREEPALEQASASTTTRTVARKAKKKARARTCKVTKARSAKARARAAKAGKSRTSKGARKSVKAKRATSTCATAPRARRAKTKK
jgi:uncharacterized protein YkwD